MPAVSEEITVLGGAPAPSGLSLRDVAGNARSLEDYAGRVVLVNFWASWCPPCVREFPSFEALSRSLDGRPFDILAVNVAEGLGAVRRFTRLQEAGLTLLHDSEGVEARAWQAEFYPTTYIIGPDGRLEYLVVGEADWTSLPYRDRIERLMPDRPLSASRQ